MSLLDVGSVPYVLYKTGSVIDSAPGGNADGRLDPGEAADFITTLRNVGQAGVNDLAGRLFTADPYVTVLDSVGSFGNVEPESSCSNEADRFRIEASPTAPKEHPVDFTLYLSGTGYSDSLEFTVLVTPMRVTDPVPDGPGQPALYWAYDDSDSGYTQRPDYSWVEIKSLGTRVNFSDNDAVVTVPLPSGFGAFCYYGQYYPMISVSADGWIAPGSYTTKNFTNTVLPSASAPPGVICPNWDDLYPSYTGAGHVYYYHDEANNRFIVEYDSVKYYDNAIRDKFEVIFYDTTFAGPDGNTTFEFQYMTANGYASSTVGIQNQARTTAIQCLYDANYHVGCARLGPQRAIRFTTNPPTGVAEEKAKPQVPLFGLSASPNPFRTTTLLRMARGTERQASFRIYDNTGRLVRTLTAGRETSSAVWDGRDETGDAVAPGIYFCSVSGDAKAWTKVVLTR